MKRTDEELVLLFQNGRNDAFQELIIRYESKVKSSIGKVTDNNIDQEDLAQEVFIKVYESLHQFRHQSSFSTWIYRVTMNIALDWKRRRLKVLEEEWHEEMIVEDDRIEQLLMNREKEHQLKQLVASLPITYQQVITLFYEEEFTYKEISLHLNIPIKTVETRLYRAKNKLKQRWQKEASNL